MAEGTRSHDFKRLEDTIKIVNQLQTTTEIQAVAMMKQGEALDRQTEVINEVRNLISALTLKHDQLAIQVTNASTSSTPNSSRTNQFSTGGDNGGNFTGNWVNPRFNRIDFPKFSGDDPEGWVYRCQKFFEIHTIDETQKVRLAAIHLEDKAISWYRWFERSHTVRTWREFTVALINRFNETVYEDVVGHKGNAVEIQQVTPDQMQGLLKGKPQGMLAQLSVMQAEEPIDHPRKKEFQVQLRELVQEKDIAFVLGLRNPLFAVNWSKKRTKELFNKPTSLLRVPTD
ncbi:hypothetical protein Vadar_014288 [Vaccinium darrowii]|uniref:Uncharacterized protein n=1 Tax=Vaccinium darrowii TaxID=229202 RepID=A0ACB7XA78_9ERIC|nr:hypothetical protein Vadar_014288 [Vaccinium darrowii]